LISSEPEELEQYIYTGLYEDASILAKSRFVPVGDAGIRFDFDNSWYSETGIHAVFEIKAK